LEVNGTKTRLAGIPGDNITFLGYTLGQFYGKEGRPYIGTRPSRKAVKSLLKRIQRSHD
jgi:RNA-directed DNA polymerase